MEDKEFETFEEMVTEARSRSEALRELAKRAQPRPTDTESNQRRRLVKLGGVVGSVNPVTGMFEPDEKHNQKNSQIEVTEGYRGDSTPFPADE